MPDNNFFLRGRVKVLPLLLLEVLVCLTVRAADDVPEWAMKLFNQKLGTRYELIEKVSPSFYVGDFNGDAKSDVALTYKREGYSQDWYRHH